MALSAFNSFGNKLIGSNVVGSPIPINYSWTEENGIYDYNWSSICFAKIGNTKVFVAVGSDISGITMKTNDTFTWTPNKTVVANNWKGLCYGNSVFVAVANSTATKNVMTSADGATWTLVSTLGNWNSVCYGNDIFVAVGDTGTIMTGNNTGSSWTARTSGTTTKLNSVCYGNNTFVAVGDSGTIITSPDGISWATQSSGTSSQINSVCYGNNGSNTFIAVGNSIILLSVNIITNWTIQKVYYTDPNSPILLNWTSVCSVVTDKKTFFIAVANTHVNMTQRVMSSFNGILWNLGYATSDNNWSCVCSGIDRNDNTIVVAVSNTSNKGYSAMTNLPLIFPTGSTWNFTTSTAYYNPVSPKCFVCGNGLFGISSTNYNAIYISTENCSYSTVTVNIPGLLVYFGYGAYGNGVYCFSTYSTNGGSIPQKNSIAYSVDGMQTWNFIDISGATGTPSKTFATIIYTDKSFHVISKITQLLTFDIINNNFTLSQISNGNMLPDCFKNGYYYNVGAGNGATPKNYSTDGVNYSTISCDIGNPFYPSICSGNGYVLLGLSTYSIYNYSTNYTSFTSVSISPLVTMNGVVGYANGLFVLFAKTNLYVFKSPILTTNPANTTTITPTNKTFTPINCVYFCGKLMAFQGSNGNAVNMTYCIFNQ